MKNRIDLFGKPLPVSSEPAPDWFYKGDISPWVKFTDACKYQEEDVQLVITSPPDLHEIGLTNEWDKLYSLYETVFTRCVKGLRADGVFVVLISDRKWKRSIVWKHAEIRRIAEKLGLVCFLHKIVVKHTHIDLYRPGFSHLLCFRKPTAHGSRLKHEFLFDIIGPFAEFRGVPSFKNASGFTPQLMDMLIRSFSREGTLVADPFCGTGTALRVALGLKRCAVGFEIDPSLKRCWKAI